MMLFTKRAALLVLLLSFIAFAQGNKISPAMQSLADTERAFARTSVEKGVRESFIAFFAEDGLNFQPHPVNTQEAYRRRPAPAGPQPFTLDWRPVFGDVSAADDLGFDTGPYTVTDKSTQPRPTQHGMFFSVWRKQPDGTWKVVIDIGISTPGPVAPLDAPFRQAKGNGTISTQEGKESGSDLLVVERALMKVVQKQGVAKAYLSRISDEARLHRNNIMPVVGKKAIQSFLSATPLTLACETMKADVARSGDLGWTLGKYELQSGAGGKTEKGYYVRVWKKYGSDWKLLADVTNALPPEEK